MSIGDFCPQISARHYRHNRAEASSTQVSVEAGDVSAPPLADPPTMRSPDGVPLACRRDAEEA